MSMASKPAWLEIQEDGSWLGEVGVTGTDASFQSGTALAGDADCVGPYITEQLAGWGTAFDGDSSLKISCE